MKLISLFTSIYYHTIYAVSSKNMKLFSHFTNFFLDFYFVILYNVMDMKNEVRVPRQERAIEKKKRIVEAGFELFSEFGYYGTNTAEIAKKAGVSTGIVYGYFADKRDILISVLEIYIQKVVDPILKLFDKLSNPIDFSAVVTKVLDQTIKIHKSNRKIHEALHSLASNDEAVNAEFMSLEDSITVKIAEKFNNLGLKIENAMEKVHFAMNIIQTFSHEYVFDKHEYIDYIAMREMVIKTIISLFE